MKKKFRIILSAGHSAVVGFKNGKKIDNGASGNGYIEGVVADELRDLVVSELKKLETTAITDGDDTTLADSIREFKKHTDADTILVEFHFNAATPKATGTEVLIPDNHDSIEKEVADKIAKATAKVLGIINRGVKTESDSKRGRLGWMRQLSGHNILPEVCFISNASDMKAYNDNKVELAKELAKILHSYASQEGQTECFYTVVAGDTLSKIAAKHNTTVTKLKKDNGLSSDLIKVGQKLKL